MARYTDSVCRMCRREGTKLFLKGEKCFSSKCAQQNRPTPPGQHGQARQRKASEYGLQLREKQKARRAYGLMEGQFKRTFARATGMKGITGDNLLQLLELRLDNVVYRSGLAASRAQARQLVCHGLMTVNGKKVDIPSYLVKPGDVVEVAEKSRSSVKFKRLTGEDAIMVTLPQWLEREKNTLKGTVTKMPAREDIDMPIEEHLIVELYSK